MTEDEYLEALTAAFDKEKANAVAYAAEHNGALPKACPACGEEGHVPGLRCPKCGYKHGVAWAVIRSTEYGYDVVALAPPRRLFASFVVVQ